MASEPLYSRQIKHAIYIERYKGGTVGKIISLLNKADADLVAQIIKRDPTAVAGAWSTRRLETLLTEIRAINKAAYESVNKELTKELKAFAAHEAEWQASALQSTIPGVSITAPAMTQVEAAVFARPFQGRLLKEALTGVEAARAARVRDAIRLGFVEGETIDQMVRRIRGTKAAGYANGLLEVDRRGAAALVRTAVAHTANVARQATWAANDDVVVGWRFTATLDGRTSVTCASLSGKEFPVGKGPQPPRHWNCRSTTTPVLAPEFSFLSEGATQASMDGPVDRGMNYSQWLRGQPASFQDDVLGPTRGALFRKGGLSIDRFTDRRGNEYSLADLKRRDAEAFERAGL